MCGISGWLSWGERPNTDIVEAMTREMVHRGPDAGATVADGPIVLGHRRLAVIDLRPSANQPMLDGDGVCRIVFNGEIFNFLDLRAELAQTGAKFQTESDTEVILEAYKRWGTECFTRLNGMFAIALWDGLRQRLVLARDRLGEKPLFFGRLGTDQLVFASELKALLHHPGFKRRLEPRALGQFLRLNYVLSDACLIDGVEKLPPAHVLTMERGRGVQIHRYWDPAPAFCQKAAWRSKEAAAERLRELINDAVRIRMISDVPLGAFLSGGIDSASIVAAMVRHAGRDAVNTFNIGFHEKSFDESETAREAAAFFHTHHRHRTVVASQPDELGKIVRMADEPIADTSIVPTYHLAAFAREHVKVCLAGDGGDEIFCGYETYAADRLHHWLRWMPDAAARLASGAADGILPVSLAKVSFDYKLRKFLPGLMQPADRAHYSWRTIFADGELHRLLRPEHHASVLGADPAESFLRHAQRVKECHYLDRGMYVDLHTWLPDNVLAKVDKATMAHSLESRAPFLDHRLVEFAASLPVSWKLRGFETKHLLREAQKQRLPAVSIRGAKKGFGAPLSIWLRGPLGEQGRAATLEGGMAEWFEPREVTRIWDDHISGRRDNGYKLFGLMCLGMWIDRTISSPLSAAQLNQ